jgi:hypothetical protein
MLADICDVLDAWRQAKDAVAGRGPVASMLRGWQLLGTLLQSCRVALEDDTADHAE